jgi:hypothetical protein
MIKSSLRRSFNFGFNSNFQFDLRNNRKVKTMIRSKIYICTLVVTCAFVFNNGLFAQGDPLPSWNGGPTKQAIMYVDGKNHRPKQPAVCSVG